MNEAVTFEPVHFAEGRFRYAYMGTWLKPPSKRGKKCVVKEKKDSYCWKSTDWDTTMKIQKKAVELAASFTSLLQFTWQITFTDTVIHQVLLNQDPHSHPKLGEYVVVEDYIPGTFKKWCNNYGYISAEAESVAIAMPAFMHWSWVHSGGELMIADLQGVCSGNHYTLTDPVILSSNREYGVTDMGIEGMAMFFMHHKCNALCQRYRKPTIFDFMGKIPQHMLSACLQMLQQVGGTTSYLHELQFSPHVRTIVAQTMREIATRPY